MNNNNRATWLRKKINSALEDISEDPLWNHLMKRFHLTPRDVAETYFQYEYDVYSFGNEIYNSIEMRFVLYLLSIKPGSWHVKEQSIVDDWLHKLCPCNMVDIGFGVPQKYHFDRLSDNKKGTITLVEANQLALDFAKEMFTFQTPEMKNIKLLNGDFFESAINDKLSEVPNVWIFLDSLEHFKNPEDILNKCVSTSEMDTHYVFSLPLGERVSAHTLSWENKEEAFEWLNNKGFHILDSYTLHPNPEIEWFIHSLNEKIKELLILAKR